MKRLLFIILLTVLTGCSMPLKSIFKHNAKSISVPGYQEKIPIVEWSRILLQEYIAVVVPTPSDEIAAGLKDIPYTRPNKLLQVGDTVEVTAFDAGEDGLLVSGNSKELKLGRSTIDRSGTISLPFINHVRANNLTPESLQLKIKNALKGYTINPQVLVTVVSKVSDSVFVDGAVKNPGQYKLEAGHERLLDLLALAGGTSVPDGQITLIRKSGRASAALSTVVEDREQNVLVQPDDRIILGDAKTEQFTAMGAFKKPGEFKFEPGKLSLSQAISLAGNTKEGDETASDIYIFRSAVSSPTSETTKSAPRMVGYHINISDVSSNLSIQRFFMRNGDTLFAAKEPISG